MSKMINVETSIDGIPRCIYDNAPVSVDQKYCGCCGRRLVFRQDVDAKKNPTADDMLQFVSEEARTAAEHCVEEAEKLNGKTISTSNSETVTNMIRGIVNLLLAETNTK